MSVRRTPVNIHQIKIPLCSIIELIPPFNPTHFAIYLEASFPIRNLSSARTTIGILLYNIE